MESELYISLLLRGSDFEDSTKHALETIKNHLGWHDIFSAEALLFRLADPRHLQDAADILECDPLQVYQRLRIIVDSSEGISMRRMEIIGETVKERDLNLLFDLANQKKIGKELLDCPAGEALQTIFRVDGLRAYLIEASIVKQENSEENDAESLLYQLLGAYNKGDLQRIIGARNILEHLQYSSIINPYSKRNICKKLNCSEHSVLVALLSWLKKPRDISIPQNLKARDSLGRIAMTKIIVILKKIENEFLQQALNSGKFAHINLALYRKAQLIDPIIRFHLAGEYKSAIAKILYNKQPLFAFGFKRQFLNPTFLGTEDSDLILEEDQLAEDNYSLTLMHAENEERTEIIKFTELSEVQIEHLKRNLPGRIKELPDLGNSLGQRILNTPIPILDHTLMAFLEIFKSPEHAGQAKIDHNYFDEHLIQAMILSNLNLIPSSLKQELEFIPQKKISDSDINDQLLVFEKSHKAIEKEVREELEKGNCNVNLI